MGQIQPDNSSTVASMYALTLLQPWASMMALGNKRYETRSWGDKSAVGKLIAIHSSRRLEEFGRKVGMKDRPFNRIIPAAGLTMDTLPLGKIIAVGRLAHLYEVEMKWDGNRVMSGLDRVASTVLPNDDERAMGDFSVGRTVWEFSQIIPLADPLDARGNQRLWLASTALQHAIVLQLHACGQTNWADELALPSLTHGRPQLEALFMGEFE